MTSRAMQQVEAILVLLAALAALATLARRLKVAYPILMVMGGLALGLVPGLPRTTLSPGAIFLLFIPPLIYTEAVYTPWRDFRSNLRPISLLAVGLVLATALAVAAVAHEVIDGMTWPVALLLGTIVAPPDAVAVAAVTARLRVPRQVITVLEGESLVNDAAALVGYQMAVAAVMTGEFLPGRALLRFPWAVAGGAAIGLAVGVLAVGVRRRLNDPPVEVTVSLLIPFAAYLPAEAVGASGVLAVVAAGLYVGRHIAEAFPAESRMLGVPFWRMIEFLLNGLAFLLIGLELVAVCQHLTGYSVPALLAYAALVSLTAILTRIVWVFAEAYLKRAVSPAVRRREPPLPWQEVTVVAWAGIRGVATLATALALPPTISEGGPFPHRDLVVFLAFTVILSTLVLQGLGLPVLIRWLGLQDEGRSGREESEARLAAAQAALELLDQLAAEPWVPTGAVEPLHTMYQKRVDRYRARLDPPKEAGGEGDFLSFSRLRILLLKAERQAIIDLRDRDVIGDEAMRRVERDLDLEESRLNAD
jgi:monovalent cation/hydrogen antiporter